MRSLLLALALLGGPIQPAPPAQAPSTPPPSVSASPAPGSEYRVGAGDTLDIVVFGNEDLTRAATIQTNGTISFPLLGEVPVAGLTLDEVKRKLTTLLAKDYLVSPQVEVRVREYQSQFVLVVGEVNNPGRKALRGRTRLIDALVEAGGFSSRASGEVVITRTEGTFESGAKSITMRLGSSNMTVEDQVNVQVPLRAGDIVTASPKYYVTVEGEVSRPGRYVLEGDLTVMGAISSAGGLTRFGSSSVKIRRVNLKSGQAEIITVDLNAVRKGKTVDTPLLPNDVVSVSRRFL